MRVHASRHGMAVIGLDGGRAAGKSREQDDGAEGGKQNGSHSFSWFHLVFVDDR